MGCRHIKFDAEIGHKHLLTIHIVSKIIGADMAIM